MILDKVIDVTKKYIDTKNKNERKKIGQFFTSKETANFMSNLSKINKSSIRILDAGAGTGILSIALLEKLDNNKNIKEIEIDLYENDENIVDILEKNISSSKLLLKKLTNYNIIQKNFILDDDIEKEKYDVIISNPPYKKIGKNDVEAKKMEKVIYGQPNLYFLFMAKAVELLKLNGEMIFIVPRSWTSGTYFKKFREMFLENTRLTNIHLFVSRDKVFNKENVLQETMILRAVKTKEKQNKVQITQSNSNEDFDKIIKYDIEYDVCIEKENERYVYLPINDDDIKVLQTVNEFDTKLKDIGLKLKTGLTVDFRNEKYIEKYATNENVPLFSSIHFKNGFVNFPSEDEELQYINKDNTALLQKNTNYLFIKRFSSKEESRRIQPAMFFKNEFESYDYISTENHINFIGSIDNKELSKDLVYGLYGLYNSTLYDKYYRLLNGSTQVNATEINNIPIPNEEEIKKIGKKLQEKISVTTEVCDNILWEAISNGQVK